MTERKVAIVTGGTSGLGLAVVKALKREYLVVNAARRSSPEADLNLNVDLLAPAAADRVAEFVKTELGWQLDLLVNNAGIGAYGTFDELSVPEVRKVMELDFFAPVRLTAALLPLLEKSGGTVVNIASMAAKIHVPAMGAYCAAKSAFAQYSECSRVELKKRHIRVLTAYPGRVDTGFSSRAIKYREVPDTPANKGVTPEDFARKLIKSLHGNAKRCYFPWYYPLAAALAKCAEPFYERACVKAWKL